MSLFKAYSTASPKPILGGRQNNIFFPVFLTGFRFSYSKLFIFDLLSLFNIFHNCVFLLK